MERTSSGLVGKLDFGPNAASGLKISQSHRQALRLVSSTLVGPEKYRMLDVKRRRAQIRARRELGLI
jgi:hypothetical protein